MRKKLLCILWYVGVASCSTLIPSPQVDFSRATKEAKIQIVATNATEAITEFEYSERCPNVCWLGIHPGSTTIEDAKEILQSSEQIHHDYFRALDEQIQALWLIGRKKFRSNVFLTVDKGYIESIALTTPSVIRVRDIVKLLGEPNVIHLGLYERLHAEGVGVSYSLYYVKQRVRIVVLLGSWNGPNPDDIIDGIGLSEKYDSSDAQPWLGNSNFDKYLPGQKLPTPYYLTPRPNE